MSIKVDENQSIEPASEKPKRRSSPLRILRTIFWLIATALSLLVFPGSIGVMFAFWLLVATYRVFVGKSFWLVNLVVVAIALAKGLHQTWALYAFILVLLIPVCMALAKHVIRVRVSQTTVRKINIAAVVVCWAMVLMYVCNQYRNATSQNSVILNPKGPVVCIGDSLTSGVNPYGGYPAVLKQIIDEPVVNFGHEGITSSEGLKRLSDISSLKPKVVVIELGGHDYLKSVSRDQISENLEQLIVECKKIGAVPLLMEIPRGAVRDPYFGLERELAAKHDLTLIGDGAIRWLVYQSKPAPTHHLFFWSAPKSDDGIHANDQGNVMLANRVARALRRDHLINSTK